MNKYRYSNLTLNGRFAVKQTTEVEIANPNEVPMHGSYGGLLFDPRWKTKRAEIVTRDGGCVICQSNDELQVHHRQYQYIKSENAFRAPWDYADHLLITLCKNCHTRGHSKYKVPILIIS